MEPSSPANAMSHGAIVLPDSIDSYPGVTGSRHRRLPAWILFRRLIDIRYDQVDRRFHRIAVRRSAEPG